MPLVLLFVSLSKSKWKSSEVGGAKKEAPRERERESETCQCGTSQGQKLMVDPRLDKPVKLFPAPFSFGSVAGAPELSASKQSLVLDL